MDQRISRHTLTAWACALALCSAASPATAVEQEPSSAAAHPVSADPAQDERAAIADRARTALTTPAGYRLTPDGPVLLSTPTPGTNHLGLDGSNADLNVYNNYNGLAWCGYFAAAMWNHQAVPENYPGSQSWRTGLGTRFHAYTETDLPQTGDVLVWTNTDDTAHGHVGVVVDVTGTTVTTVEGNTGAYSDSVATHVYTWQGPGPTRSGKTFRGFASRF